MRWSVVLAGLGVWLVVACGGATGAGEGSAAGALAASEPALGPLARSLIAYHEGEWPGLPCPGYRLGDEVPWGDFTLRVDEVGLAEPWLKAPVGPDERFHLGPGTGMRVLVMRYAVRNDTPVKKALDAWTWLATTDGDTNYWYQGNRAVFAAMRGIDEAPDLYPPGAWVEVPAAAAVHAGGAAEAALYLTWDEERFDPTDPSGRRKVDVVTRHALVDLGSPPDLGALAPP